MPRDPVEVLKQARDELYLVRVLVRGLRNRTKTDAAALFDSEQRIEGLISEVEQVLNGSPDQEVQGHGSKAHLSQTH